ncbi:MAG: hypothetical protein Q8Q89_03005 [bacterium]|nr:hypothetical protein [bacterium]
MNKIIIVPVLILIGANVFIFANNKGIISHSGALLGEINSPTPKPTPLILPQITIPGDRKLKANEVANLLLALDNFGSQTEEKYNFVKTKTKEIWSNLGIEGIESESGWSSWENEGGHYPGSFDEISLTDIDILDSPGKEKVLKVIGDTEDYRLLIFDEDNDFLGQLGYEWQKYDSPEYRPVLIGPIPYLAVRHMVGGGSGTSTYVMSLYQLNNSGKLGRVLTNVLWERHSSPITRELKDGRKLLGTEWFDIEISETGYTSGILYIEFSYVSTYEPYEVFDDGHLPKVYLPIGESEKDKYSEKISGRVRFLYDSKRGEFLTQDTKWKRLMGVRTFF